MKILVLNCGSTSIKFELFENEKSLCEGLIEDIQKPISKVTFDGKKNIEKIDSYRKGLKFMRDILLKSKTVRSLDEIKAVGHRVVHGGKFSKSVVINKNVLKEIKKNIHLAPLHNPANIKGIEMMQKELPKAKHIAVFDTAFHQTMPEKAFMYAIPYTLYKKYGIRKYGFHGTSHKYVAIQSAKALKKPLNKLNLITCHLGGGCSICAIKKGISIDTSMGFTPLEGLMMTTRSGDIDPAVIFYLHKEKKMKIEKIEEMLNKKSGIKGISGQAGMKEALEKAKKGHKLSKLAVDMFMYRLQKYIGAYITILGCVDAIILTAGIGEKSKEIRKKIKKAFPRIKILVIPTDEEKMIAIETKTIVK